MHGKINPIWPHGALYTTRSLAMIVHTIEESIVDRDAPVKERTLRLCKAIKTKDDLWQLHAILNDALTAGEIVEVDLWEVSYE